MLGESDGAAYLTIEEIGRGRMATRAASLAVVLLLVQQPMVSAVRTGVLPGSGCVIPARLSLLVDGLFILAYVCAAHRVSVLVRLREAASWKTPVQFGKSLIYIAALLDVGENIWLWRDFSPAGTCADLSTGWLTWSLRGVWLIGAALLCSAALLSSRYAQKRFFGSQPAARVSFRRPAPSEDADQLMICCSGGGVQSAPFCLGALQHLRERGVYDRATAVIGVSGGGYIAAAFHVLRRTIPDPFHPESGELARLRRQTRYLTPGLLTRLGAAPRILFGVAVTAAQVAAALAALSWVLGWSLGELGVVTLDHGKRTVHWVPTGAQSFLWWSIALLVVGALLYLTEIVWERWARMPDWIRRGLTRLAGSAFLGGLVVAALTLGVPAGLFLLERLPGLSTLAPFLPAGFDEQSSAVQRLAAFTAPVAALAGLGRSVWKGLTVEGGEPPATGLRQRAVAFARTSLAPWLGVVIIFGIAAIVLIHWTGRFATDPALQADWSLAWKLVLVVVATKLLTDLNRTSLHPYYRQNLSGAYLAERLENGAVVTFDYTLRLRYSEWARPTYDGPRLVLAAVANVADAAFVPGTRDCVPFIFDPETTGIVGGRSLPEGRQHTAEYEWRADPLRRDITVPSAMAISGSAFSSLPPRTDSQARPVRLLLALLNARLGIWLPNPYWRGQPDAFPDAHGPIGRLRRYIGGVLDKPGPYWLLREALGKPSMFDRRILVTDGGDYDNLGLVEALRRRPAQVIVIDFSNDPEDRFSALAHAISTARIDHGIQVDLDPSPMLRAGQDRAERSWISGIATHPWGDGDEHPLKTEIFYLKSVLSGHLSWDIEEYAARHPNFPRNVSTDRPDGEQSFEAYRALGHTLARSMLDDRDISSRLSQ